MDARRIMVVGPPGAGKSTFARRLGARLGHPVVHLDAEFWRPGWEEPSKAAWARRHHELVQGGTWVIDGNYTRCIQERLERADLVIYLHVNRWVSLHRVIRRVLLHRGEVRQDMAPGCPEPLDLDFLRYVWAYEKEKVPHLEDLLASHDLEVVRLTSEDDRERFLLEARVGSLTSSVEPGRTG